MLAPYKTFDRSELRAAKPYSRKKIEIALIEFKVWQHFCTKINHPWLCLQLAIWNAHLKSFADSDSQAVYENYPSMWSHANQRETSDHMRKQTRKRWINNNWNEFRFNLQKKGIEMLRKVWQSLISNTDSLGPTSSVCSNNSQVVHICRN